MKKNPALGRVSQIVKKFKTLDVTAIVYTSITVASGAFFFTDSIPLSLAVVVSYDSLVPMIWLFVDLRLNLWFPELICLRS